MSIRLCAAIAARNLVGAPHQARVCLAGQDADRDQDGEHCRQNEKCLVDLVHDETPNSNL